MNFSFKMSIQSLSQTEFCISFRTLYSNSKIVHILPSILRQNTSHYTRRRRKKRENGTRPEQRSRKIHLCIHSDFTKRSYLLKELSSSGLALGQKNCFSRHTVIYILYIFIYCCPASTQRMSNQRSMPFCALDSPFPSLSPVHTLLLRTTKSI